MNGRFCPRLLHVTESIANTVLSSSPSRSIRSLNKLGFLEIAAYAEAPDDDRIFFYLPKEYPEKNRNMVEELISYYKRENLQMKIVPSELSDSDVIF
jgi:hypothetical protein